MLCPETLRAANRLTGFLAVSLLPITGGQLTTSTAVLCVYMYIARQLHSVFNFEESYYAVLKIKLWEMTVLLIINRKINTPFALAQTELLPNPDILVALKPASQMGLLQIQRPRPPPSKVYSKRKKKKGRNNIVLKLLFSSLAFLYQKSICNYYFSSPKTRGF